MSEIDPIHQPVQTGRIVRVRQLSSQAVQLTVEAPSIAAAAKPGQFVNIEVNHFLRRPIGVMAVDRKAGLIDLGIRIQGKGSLWLSRRRPDDELSLLGPLGNGFSLEGFSRVITVGGGTGVFPLYFVQQVCREQGIDSLAVCGYRSRDESMLADAYAAAGCQVLFASDAGDMDVPGHAAQALDQLLDQIPPVEKTVVLTCGPRPMMAAVAGLAADRHLDCQVSLEERMACGIGVCLVCVCKTRSRQQPETIVHARCCVEGPVFPAGEVVW